MRFFTLATVMTLVGFAAAQLGTGCPGGRKAHCSMKSCMDSEKSCNSCAMVEKSYAPGACGGGDIYVCCD
ncbi:hypothetical protein HDZ31DRAFT_61764 [Schizophyllum fasciatum]